MKSAAWYKHLIKKYHSGRSLYREPGDSSGPGRGVWGCSVLWRGVLARTGMFLRVKMVLSCLIMILFNPSELHPLQNPFETSIFTQHKREMQPVLLCDVNLLIYCNL